MNTPSNEPMRLQKYLSQQGYCSRRSAEELIRAGKITLNGQRAQLGDRVTERDTLVIGGQQFIPSALQTLVLLYNKPVGVECTFRPRAHLTTLADVPFGVGRVFNVGRLDRESHGLLLLTNDGELCNRLTHPRYQHEKEYRVALERPVSDALLRAFRAGVRLPSGKQTRPAVCEQTGEYTLRVVLREGQNRQIRLTAEHIGNVVADLQRVRVQQLVLGELPVGEWRALTESEVVALRHSVGL